VPKEKRKAALLDIPKVLVYPVNKRIIIAKCSKPVVFGAELARTTTLLASLEGEFFRFSDVLMALLGHLTNVVAKTSKLLLDLMNNVVRILFQQLLVQVIDNVTPTGTHAKPYKVRVVLLFTKVRGKQHLYVLLAKRSNGFAVGKLHFFALSFR
jgi:hypothetical protein